MTTAEKFVTRRHPDADVYPVTADGSYDTHGAKVTGYVVIDDADSNDGKIIGQGVTEAEAWQAAAKALGSKRAA